MPLRVERTTLALPKEVRVRRFVRRQQHPKSLFAALGLVALPFVAFKEVVDNAVTVLCERVYYHKVGDSMQLLIPPSRDKVFTTLRQTWRQLRRILPRAAAWSQEEFLGTFSGRKREMYARAVARLNQGWSWSDVDRWSRVRAFIKHEKLPVVAGKRVVPRIIQPRSPEYNVLVGCYLKAAEHRIYDTLQSLFGETVRVVGKGVNVIDLAADLRHKWDSFTRPVAVGLDHSRYDQHISRAILEWEHRVYRHMYHDKILAGLLKRQLRTKGTILVNDGCLSFTTEGGRCSGDINTGLGNTLMMATMVHQYLLLHGLQYRVKVIFNGDDSLIFCEESDLHLLDGLPAYFTELGFILKVENPEYTFEKVSFCQMQPVMADGVWKMVRSFPLAVNKDVVTTFRLTRDNYLDYMATVGQCGLALSTGVPVYQAYYSWMSALGQNDPEKFVVNHAIWARGLVAHTAPVTEEARVSFFKAFGVHPHHQLAIEEAYARLPVPAFDPEHIFVPSLGADMGCQC